MQGNRQHRLVFIAYALQQPAFRCRELQRVAVDVNALRVAPLVNLGTVGIKHRDHQQGEILQHFTGFRLVRVLQQVTVDVEQGGRRRRFVTVHL